MTQQSSNSVTHETLVPDINAINALVCKIVNDLKNGAIFAYLICQ